MLFPHCDQCYSVVCFCRCIFVLKLKQVNCIIPENPYFDTPTPTPTPTLTPTPTPGLSPTPTPTLTKTPTPTPTCPVTTQYLEMEIVNNTEIQYTLWNNSGFTSSATTLCDYTPAGVLYGNLGTIVSVGGVIPSGQHQYQFDYSSELLSGETITAFTVNIVSTIDSPCSCPVFVDFTPYIDPSLPCLEYNLGGGGGPVTNFRWINCDYSQGSIQLTGSNSTTICALDTTVYYDGGGLAVSSGPCP
jgi:hypothetical protein